MAGSIIDVNTTGTVREWNNEEGWGVIDSSETPGGCWAHFSAIHMDGYRSLEAGELVTMEFARVAQDGYSFRAESVWRTRS